MSTFGTLWRYRVGRSVHRLSTFALPAAAVIISAHVRGMTEMPPGRDFALLPYVVAGVLASIGAESSSGRLPLMLAHPVRRSTYVLSHWAASATIATGWALVGLLAETAVLAWLGRGVYAPWAHAVDRAVFCTGLSAVLTCFSARLPSWGHLGLLVLLFYLVGLSSDSVGPALKPGVLLAEELLAPRFEVHGTFDTAPMTLSHLARYAAIVSGWLLAAVLLFRNREVSYASR